MTPERHAAKHQQSRPADSALPPRTGTSLPSRTVPQFLSAHRLSAVVVGALVIALSVFAVSSSTARPPKTVDATMRDGTMVATQSGFNGSFDSSLQGWFPSPGAALSTVDGRTGGGAVRVTQTDRRNVTVLNDQINSVVSTEKGMTYVATGWVRTANPNITVALRLMEFPRWRAGADNALRGENQSVQWLRDTNWHRLSVSYTAKESGNTLDLNVLSWGLAPTRSFEVDDLQIVDSTQFTVPVEPSPTLVRPVPVPSVPKSPEPQKLKPQEVKPDAEKPFEVAPIQRTAVKVLPSIGQGAVFGFWQTSGGDFSGIENTMGRNFGAVHRYRDFNGNQLWPSAEELALAKEGKTVHFSWETMSYQGGYNASLQPAPAVTAPDAHSGGRPRQIWTYKQITNGSLDRYIDTIADRVKSSGQTFIIDFNHEADDTALAGGSNTQRKAAGTPAEYAAAYRHLVKRFQARGATNVVWAVTWSGWLANNRANWWIYQQGWPGKGYVDLVMWDPYNNRAENWRSFADIVRPVYSMLDQGLLDPVDASAKNLPRGLGEFGSIPDGRRAGWLREIPGQIKQFPKLVYLNYYSSGGWGTLHNDPAAIDALGTVIRNPYFRE